jgi:hypothetical protein
VARACATGSVDRLAALLIQVARVLRGEGRVQRGDRLPPAIDALDQRGLHGLALAGTISRVPLRSPSRVRVSMG